MTATPRTRRIPVAIRSTALAGLALTGLYAALYAAVHAVDPGAANDMLRMYGLTIVAGRETAMFDALHRGMRPSWVFGLSVIDDVGSLLLALPFTWFVLRFLRRSSRVRWALVHFEKQALLHRPWVQRWGLAGLAGFYFLPGFGAGVPITVLLGIMARIPLGRLVAFFVAATIVVDGAWTLVLTRAARALPDAAWVDAIPYAVIAIVLGAAAVGAWRGRAERHVALLDWPIHPGPEEGARLAAVGITWDRGLVRADLDVLRRALHGKEPHMGRLLLAAELLLLEEMGPQDALTLARRGIAGIEDVAVGDPTALGKKAAGMASWDLHGPTWVQQARRLVEAQHAGERGPLGAGPGRVD